MRLTTLQQRETLPQVSLSGTKRVVGGGLLPLTLLFAVLLHLSFFMIIDLRPDEADSTVKKTSALNVSFYSIKKQAPSPEPVVKKALPKEVPQQTKVSLKAKPLQKTMVKTDKTTPLPITEKNIPAKSVNVTVEPQPEPSAPVIQASATKPDLPNFSDTAFLKTKYRDTVREIIAANKKYPVRARRRGIQGSVTVAFSVYTDGVVSNTSVEGSSGFDILDKTALQILAESSPLPAPPEQMDFTVPISFKLN